MTALGLGLSGIAYAAIPVCLFWAFIAALIGRRQTGPKRAYDIAFKSTLDMPIPGPDSSLA